MAFPKWKYKLDKHDGLRATLCMSREAEEALAGWTDDPKGLGVPVVPVGGPYDASGQVAWGIAPEVGGVTTVRIGS